MKADRNPKTVAGDASKKGVLKSRIIEIASDLFVQKGYNGVSFLAIGKELGIGHSGIHYYFRTKEDLAEHVLARYCDDTLRYYRSVWCERDASLFVKCQVIRDWIYERYMRYNPDGKGYRVWGLLTRFSIDAEFLPPSVKMMIRDTEAQIESLVREAVELAVRRGELKADAPVYETTIQISMLLQLSMQLTRYAGSFQRFDDLLRCTCELIHRAYGRRKALLEWRAPPDLLARMLGTDGPGAAAPSPAYVPDA